jgi:hypothetical protein
MGVGQRVPPVRSATGRPQPHQAVELTAPSAGFGALRGVVAWGPPLTGGVKPLREKTGCLAETEWTTLFHNP